MFWVFYSLCAYLKSKAKASRVYFTFVIPSMITIIFGNCLLSDEW